MALCVGHWKYARVVVSVLVIACQTFTAHSKRTVNVCYGTSNELSTAGSAEYRYNSLRHRYENCTFVQGNLEITWIERLANANSDLSFLENIEVVTGYVLIAAVESDNIPLNRLRHIRGENKFGLKGNYFSLAVVISNIKHGIQMQNIQEIDGNVLFMEDDVCYYNTIAWEVFTKGSVSHLYEKNTNCGECDAACADHKGRRRCWGPGPGLCQTVSEQIECDWLCRNGTCFQEGILGCCHHECLGCYDHWIDTQCKLCRHYEFDGHCVPECPAATFPHGDLCLRDSDLYNDEKASTI